LSTGVIASPSLNCFGCDKACRKHVDFSMSKAYPPTPRWLDRNCAAE
jgi:hypothetical protein